MVALRTLIPSKCSSRDRRQACSKEHQLWTASRRSLSVTIQKSITRGLPPAIVCWWPSTQKNCLWTATKGWLMVTVQKSIKFGPPPDVGCWWKSHQKAAVGGSPKQDQPWTAYRMLLAIQKRTSFGLPPDVSFWWQSKKESIWDRDQRHSDGGSSKKERCYHVFPYADKPTT